MIPIENMINPEELIDTNGAELEVAYIFFYLSQFHKKKKNTQITNPTKLFWTLLGIHLRLDYPPASYLRDNTTRHYYCRSCPRSGFKPCSGPASCRYRSHVRSLRLSLVSRIDLIRGWSRRGRDARVWRPCSSRARSNHVRVWRCG